MADNIVRVLRVIEYSGPREKVEEVVARSIHGQRTFGTPGREVTIRAATLGLYPEVLEQQTMPATEEQLPLGQLYIYRNGNNSG